ncbi:MAG TPA: VCBS repeat-containing protein [Kofleriaceae bacterium]|nr:VCBS repeat-containing protein [Kofleriaceae bacterium]
MDGIAGVAVLAVADVDRDGQLDAVIASSDHAVIAILAGRGDGTFGPRTDYKTGPTLMAPIIADVNHDGLPDLLDVSPTLDTLEVLSATCLSDRR